jgi:PTH1 family peptidyl-tRNA hydrolase
VIKLFVGLGNPGVEYHQTRHNAGFGWIDALAYDLKITLSPDRAFKGLVARGTHGGQAFWLLKPSTFMNLSGQSVASLAHFFKILPSEVLVGHDELDIAPGQLKLKWSGGHAGHNGLRDIHEKLATADYWRLRIGIGHPGVRSEVVNWVLNKPTPEHRLLIETAIAKSLKATPFFLSGDLEAAQKVIHAKTPASI